MEYITLKEGIIQYIRESNTPVGFRELYDKFYRNSKTGIRNTLYQLVKIDVVKKASNNRHSGYVYIGREQ